MKLEDLNRKQVGIACGGALAVALIVFVAALTRSGESFDPSAATEKALSGEELHDEIMSRYPELRGNSRFENAEGVHKGTSGVRTNRMTLPASEWDALDQKQKNSLAQ